MTQEQIASLLQINRSTYAKYETGENAPDYETLKKLADFFDVSVDYLLERTNDPKPVVMAKAGDQWIELSPEEMRILEEIRKHPQLFRELSNATDKKLKAFTKMWNVIMESLEEYEKQDS